ncbi:MAG: hypothetical protein ACO3GO_01040 [Terrimicrobiaceae bacterium]
MLKPFQLALLAATSISLANAQETTLLKSNFDDGANPPTGWITDYEWTGNSYYVQNKMQVTIGVEAGHGSVVHFQPDAKYQAGSPMPGEGGAKMESLPFALEPGFRYKCTLDIKGGPSRIYFSGYQWAPGVRPSETVRLEDLRQAYKSKATSTDKTAEWTTVTCEFPGVALSPAAVKALSRVRFLTLYVWFMKPGSVDNIVITKVPDPSVQF